MAKKKPAKNKPAKKKSVKKIVRKPAQKSAQKKIAKKSIKKVVKKTVKKMIQKALPPKQASVQKIDYAQVITPLGERIVVRPLPTEQVTAGGIIIPGTADFKAGYTKALVLAVGAGSKNKKGHTKPLDVKVGDTILFQSYLSTKVEFNSEELHIVNESDVLGTV